MAKNRRNYYRVLHVQPEAPLEVIKSSYRTLMAKLGLHPDLGGDHNQAALINEAFAVLSDPTRRALYDHEHLPRRLRAAKPAEAAAPPPAERPAHQARAGGCPLCRAELPARIEPATRCTTCGSPLAPAPQTAPGGPETGDRRATLRRDKSHAATLHVGWPSPGVAVRWRDLSLTGLSVYAPEPVALRQPIRVADLALEAVGLVVSCRSSGRVYSVHAKIVTLIFLQSAGTFVSARA